MSKLAAQPVARTVQPHEHFVHLPTRLWKLLLAGGVATWLIAAVITRGHRRQRSSCRR